MSQYDFGTINPATKTGTALANDLNSWRDALHTLHRGSSRPSYAVAGMHWIDDSTTPWALKIFDGVSTDTTIATYNSTTKVWTPVLVDLQVTTAKLAANAVTPAKMSRTGTSGQVLTSNGTGADPSYQTLPASYSDEQAQDAAASLFTGGTHSGISFSYDDTNAKVNATVTYTAPVSSINGQTGAVVTTNLYSIGSFVWGRPINGTEYAVNATVSGSSLYTMSSACLGTTTGYVYVFIWSGGGLQLYLLNTGDGALAAYCTLVNTGSWRCVSPAKAGFYGETIFHTGLWVRYA